MLNGRKIFPVLIEADPLNTTSNLSIIEDTCVMCCDKGQTQAPKALWEGCVCEERLFSRFEKSPWRCCSNIDSQVWGGWAAVAMWERVSRHLQQTATDTKQLFINLKILKAVSFAQPKHGESCEAASYSVFFKTSNQRSYYRKSNLITEDVLWRSEAGDSYDSQPVLKHRHNTENIHQEQKPEFKTEFTHKTCQLNVVW